MKRSKVTDRDLLEHISECLDKIQECYRNGKAAYDADWKTQDAVTRRLQTMAESTQRLSGELKSTEPDIPWKQIQKLRNSLTHDYLWLDPGSAWRVVEEDLPAWTAAINRMRMKL